uniref:Major facilitator superfamily (MFS) profile domain-containing protein n=1 Tax=Entomoneis paludosa TaxID=265537 RepID=A0A7S2YFN6_9STRA|mmetsp:Transcript_30862/g.64414  ORF Transcript_30862/g.64414 Transcript_30862/m.64414 type:complete len:636 (+) Transcript_30862:90-1997(+)|eukprot:CAMPEP_0172439862 /NCGR_PEP_ID=MMETSP1065-20121228/715_1 /TAXON_ID=265537 /ORGANISM="Amphiprora paludosa, Strain CCMP125" /LENGTH=635 /DNA_ID=CAMNT_0013188615 /DNA_START=34 /DNA_END=1941 /DNA_ORIENTATION=-
MASTTTARIPEGGNPPAERDAGEEDNTEYRVELQLEALESEANRVREEYDLCAHDPFRASPESKYERYDVTVDHEHGDRATEIKLCSFKRPHMRGLHCAWISFFLAFMIWFAPAPLLKEIQDTLGLSKKEVWTSSITNDCTAIFLRMVMGPVCDAHGARLPMALVLLLAAIPTSMVGLINSATGLAVCRLFIGIAGSSFVMSQFWPSRLFSREIAGTANGLVGGWGNLGGAFTQLLMGTILFPIFRDYYDSSEKAWRVICVIPATVAFAWGCILPFISDDAPMGNYSEMKKKGAMDRVFMTTSLRQGATINTWILYILYACSFGVELVMNNGAVLYYTSEFGLSTEDASAIGFIYGSMNIFARALGGLFSDRLNLHIGMRGRLWLQLILLVCEGVTILVFAFAKTLPGAIVTMCIFSIFTQAAEGAIYGVVPYVSKLYTGSVAGLVGSGGNAGSVVYGFGFRHLPYKDAFIMMGSIVIAASSLNFFIRIPCHAGLISGEDNYAVIQARERHIRRREMERQAMLEAQQDGPGTAATDGQGNDSQGSGDGHASNREEPVVEVDNNDDDDVQESEPDANGAEEEESRQEESPRREDEKRPDTEAMLSEPTSELVPNDENLEETPKWEDIEESPQEPAP